MASQSSHSRGSAIDLTIFRLDTGMLVPMGGDFDFMDVRSHHAASGLSEEETNNRESLRAIMERSRFEAYRYEWWHYVLVDEPIRIHILTSVLHNKTEKSQTYDKEMTINKFEPGTGFPVSGLFRYMVLKPAFYLIKFLPAWQNTF